MIMQYELPCYDNHKNFYGKAIVKEEGPITSLYSYNTLICSYNGNTGEFIKYWDGYSVTTMRHINSFLLHYGLPGGGKTWWVSLPDKSYI